MADNGSLMVNRWLTLVNSGYGTIMVHIDGESWLIMAKQSVSLEIIVVRHGGGLVVVDIE